MKDTVLTSFNKLQSYCEKENFTGWDPYDGLNSKLFQILPLFRNSKIIRLAWIQFFKRSFINFRTIAGVKTGLNPKGIALFISGYCNLAKLNLYDKPEITKKIEQLSNQLLELKSIGYSGACWGYNFDWQSKAFFQPKYSPTIVVTSYAANALLDSYEITGKEKYFTQAVSSKNFILQDLKRTYSTNKNFAFSYSPYDTTSVFNASLLGARLLSRIYAYTKEDELRELAKKAVAYCSEFQNNDGSWFYSPLSFHQWIDSFHTGFNLECIHDYSYFTGDNSFIINFNKGMEYYLRKFFDIQGRSKYYNNALFPIDMHAPAQMIVTLSKTNLFANNMGLIDKVLKWTMLNMQSPKGYFYYQKKRFYTNKISYMRWTQAWMFYGLTHYLKNRPLI